MGMMLLLQRVKGRELRPWLVVVLQVNYFGVLSSEPKRELPILVDFHGPVTFEFAMQGMKSPTRR
jgi:hypothetical protein